MPTTRHQKQNGEHRHGIQEQNAQLNNNMNTQSTPGGRQTRSTFRSTFLHVNDKEAVDPEGIKPDQCFHRSKRVKSTPRSLLPKLLSGIPMNELSVDVHRKGNQDSKLDSTGTSRMQRLSSIASSTSPRRKPRVTSRHSPYRTRNQPNHGADQLEGEDSEIGGSFLIVPLGQTLNDEEQRNPEDMPAGSLPKTPIPNRPTRTRFGTKSATGHSPDVGEGTGEMKKEDRPLQQESAYKVGYIDEVSLKITTQSVDDQDHRPEDGDDIRSKASESEYEFVAHPRRGSLHHLRQAAASIRDRKGELEPIPVIVHCDNSADSNFISSDFAKMLVKKYQGFKILPLRRDDIQPFITLEGECTPKKYLTLVLRFRGASEFHLESFRLVENNVFELLVGDQTIERGGVVVQEQKGTGIAWPSFKKKPNDQQLAEQRAAEERDRRIAQQLYQNMGPQTTENSGAASAGAGEPSTRDQPQGPQKATASPTHVGTEDKQSGLHNPYL